MTIADRLNSLGIELPPPFPPAGNYLSCVIDEGLVYVGGHGPVAGDQMIRGKVGGDLTLEQGREAARMTALSILATAFPGREVVGIHAVDLVWGLGTLHCLTQQQPAW